MLETHQRNGRARLAATVICVIVIAGIVVLADHLKSKGTTSPSVSTQTSSISTGTSSSTGSADTNPSSGNATSSGTSTAGTGSYSASNDYMVPDGDESIDVSITLSNGVITAASVQNSESDPTSASFQQQFASEFKSRVVGKKISGLQISTVAGASDTTQAFNDSLSQIASKAQG